MYFSSRPTLCRMKRTSCTMDGFCLLYLLMILLMRSGDVETNPGPDRIVSEKEFLKLSKQIGPSLYKDVGINLDISIVELCQIEESSQNTSDALMAVFTRWRDKQPSGTDIRALLAERLERSDLVFLSGELLAGSLVLKRTAQPESNEESSSPTPRSGLLPSTRDFDDILVTVAKRVGKNSEIDTLGRKLGFSPEDIHGYIATNFRTPNVTYDGTLQMLLDWRDGQTNSTERGALKAALEQSGQIRLADGLFPSGQTEIDAEEAIMNGMAPWNRSRIMVVGPAGVGKTSLIRRLTGQEFDPHEKSTKGAEQNVVTNNNVSSWILVNDVKTAKDDLIQSIAMDRDSQGQRLAASDQLVTGDAERSVKVLSPSENKKIAKISQGISREEITNVKSSELGITYSMWDFGGQEIYYITHPLFLSWRSLYILVFPLNLELSGRAPREEDDENAQKRCQLKGSAVKTHRTILDLLHFWLMSVYTHAVPDSHLESTNEPKVLLIGTFAGGESMQISKKKVESKVQELKDLIGSKPYQKQVLFPICVIDNQFSQKSEVNTIQDRIDGLIKDLEYMKVRKPIRWRTLLTEIEGSDQNTLTVTEARSTMTRLGINDNEMDDVLQFYHDIGHLIYHQGCELIVLKPQFLNSIVSNIITVIDDNKMNGDQAKYWRDLKEKGILSIELIQAVWEEHRGVHDQLNNIIDMMIMFDLICEIPDMHDGGRQFFVPCRSSPMLHEKECYGKDHTVEFTIDFHHFLPDGFLHRFYVRMAKWSMEKKKSIKPTFHCRQMVFYIDSRHRVVMTNEINSKECNQIKVMVYAVVPVGAASDRKQATVNLNENIIDDLHETLEDLKKRWAGRIEYSVGILCPNCSKYGHRELIPIRDILTGLDEFASCDDGCPIDVGDIRRAFNKGTKTSLGNTTPHQDASAAAGEVSTSKARMDRIVTEKELLKLAGSLPADSYTDVAIHLGLGYTDYDNIKLQNASSLKDANFKMLMKWKRKDDGGKVEDLDKALKEADCGGISYKDV